MEVFCLLICECVLMAITDATFAAAKKGNPDRHTPMQTVDVCLCASR